MTFNKISQANILNYLSAIKTSLANLGVDISPFNEQQVRFNKALIRQQPFSHVMKSIIDTDMLNSIAKQCDNIFMGFVFKAAFLLSFFSFLRISNLVPHSIASYDYLKQLARGDIIFAPPGAHVVIKWSKTLQDNKKIKVLKIPSLSHSILCPVAALNFLLKSTPGSQNSPLFQIKCFSSWVPLTDTRLQNKILS